MATPSPRTRAPRVPQDHKPKAAETGPEAPFVFKHAGKTYELSPAADFMTAGFARQNRHLSQAEQLFLIIEGLADDETLAAIDTMKGTEFKQFQQDFYAHNGVELGE